MELDNTHDMDDAAVLPDTGTSGKKEGVRELSRALTLHVSFRDATSRRTWPNNASCERGCL
jgi:hypothetical protein